MEAGESMTFTIECPYCGTEMDIEAEGAELQEIEDDKGALVACEECKADTEYELIDGSLLAIADEDNEEDDDEEEDEPTE
jgi:DNA-directed RNA polymerase subunit RPC12/RpoP